METWRVSKADLAAGPGSTPEQVCGIENPGSYRTVRFDRQLSFDLSDTAATAQTTSIDENVSRFLTSRGWKPIKVSTHSHGIPDLTRCSRKETAFVQIYRTTGRCTMNSPCTAYDGFAVVFYLPRTAEKESTASRK